MIPVATRDTDVSEEPECALSREWIDEHNARVLAFRAEHYPRIEALTDEECRRIYARWTTLDEHMAANKIALEFREELGMTWPDENAVGIGMKMIHTVLVRLDEYDPDFRPRPEPEFICELGDGSLWYLPAASRLRVRLGDRHEDFRPTHAPRFGVDPSDMAAAYEALERLEIQALKPGSDSDLADHHVTGTPDR
jgi:hypothetical protein|nr:hypothetical protein [Neorhizobium tomejilense]